MYATRIWGECSCRNCWLFGITAKPKFDQEDRGLPVGILAAWYGRCEYFCVYRVGFWRGLKEDIGREGISLIDGEAKRLHAEWDEHEPIRPDGWPIDRTAWMVYADWLDEHDFPINAKAVRYEYGDPAFRHPVEGDGERKDVLRPKNPEPLRRLFGLGSDGDTGAVRSGGWI